MGQIGEPLMFFWGIIEPLIAVAGILFIFSQIIFPALMDRPLFPAFRKTKKKEYDQVLRNIHEVEEEDELLKQIKNESSKLRKGSD